MPPPAAGSSGVRVALRSLGAADRAEVLGALSEGGSAVCVLSALAALRIPALRVQVRKHGVSVALRSLGAADRAEVLGALTRAPPPGLSWTADAPPLAATLS